MDFSIYIENGYDFSFMIYAILNAILSCAVLKEVYMDFVCGFIYCSETKMRHESWRRKMVAVKDIGK